LNRRNFIEKASLFAAPMVFPIALPKDSKPLRLTFSLVADAHQDLLHDVEWRLEQFIERATNSNSDFILQLGDFCFPETGNLNFLSIWNQFVGPKYHVLGNHDMDTSTKSQTADFWGMPEPHYSFDVKGVHFVVLDANYLNNGGQYKHYANANFYVDSNIRTWIHPEQLDWLASDLNQTSFPTIIFSHQSLANDLWGVNNRTLVQSILEEANRKAGHQKVLACFNGHNHIDSYRKINEIHYIDINSLSYQWLGKAYATKTRYSEDLYVKYPMLENMATYNKPLSATIKIENDLLKIEGASAQYVGESPQELGLSDEVYGIPFTSLISSRQFKL